MAKIPFDIKSKSDRFAINVKRNLARVKTIGKAIIMLFKLAYKMVSGIIKGIAFIFSNLVAFLIATAILISVYGVTVVIIADELEFVLNPDKEDVEELDLSAMSDEDRYLAMAKALNRDLIEDYYTKNTNGFKEWYDKYNVTGSMNENPAMMVDLFLLLDDIYTRPEINSDNYDTLINKFMVLGCSKVESQMVLPNGTRIFNSEVDLSSNPYYVNPLGNSPNIWTSNTNRNTGSGIGCTFISKYEKSSIPDEQRAILGGAGNIRANNAWYITEDALAMSEDMPSISSSDEAIKYLSTIRLNNKLCSYRGFTSFIPDAFYNFAYTTRIVAEGRDRDTHASVPSYHYSGGNASAVIELKNTLGLTKEQAGTIMTMLYCGDRHFHCDIDALPNFENFSSLNQDIAGLAMTVNITLYLEGYLDSIADEYNGKLSSIASYGNIAEKIYGDVSYTSGMSRINNITPDCYYSKCLTAMQSGDLTFNYSSSWETIYKNMKDKGPGLANQIPFSSSERLVRMVYPACCYVAGSVCYKGIQNVVEACYNYQDSNSKYVFRTADIDLGDTERVNSGGRKGIGGWVNPVNMSSNPNINSPYQDPNRGSLGEHWGLDISSSSFYGTELYAVKDGTIIWSGDSGDGYGYSVLLDIGEDTVVRYAHGSATKCKAGDKVKAGDLLMLAGSTGFSTGPHLHLEVLHPNMNDNYVIGSTNNIYHRSGTETEDPYTYIKEFFG